MADNKISDADRLTGLRAKIDAVDEAIHGLLMQRATVIDELIKVKGAATTDGAAFRPGREASMMEILSARHRGSIPLSMIGHIWREIISTFTWLQANYDVHVATGDGDTAEAMHDMARYQFGFTVPLHVHTSADDAFDAAMDQKNAVALIATNAPGNWWHTLGADNAMMVMTRLPVMDQGFQTVDCLAIAPPLIDPTPFDVRVYTGRVSSESALDQWTGGEVLRSERTEGGHAVMIALPDGGKTPHDLLDIRAAGGYFAPKTDHLEI